MTHFPICRLPIQPPAKTQAIEMLSSMATYVVMIATLVIVAAYAITISRGFGFKSAKTFVSAKNSQSAFRLGWCFFASGMGSWTLFSFPEIGIDAGSWGVIGYTLSSVAGMILIGWVGPYTRSVIGDGVTMSDVMLTVYVGLIAVFYQFISIASELTCVGQLAVILSPDSEPLVPIIAVAIITNIYLIIGGLRASLATDVWQGIGVLSLLAAVCVAMIFTVEIPKGAWSETNVAAFTKPGFETLVTLIIAVAAANMFFTGFWQRVYAGYDDSTVRRGALYACIISVPFTVALALAGMVSYLAYPDGVPFFAIVLNMGRGWQVLVAIVVAALASGVCDSIQIGIAAELVTCFPDHLNLTTARVICFLLNIPAIVIAKQEYNILNLFLIADLLCTAALGPMLLGAWSRATRAGAIAGSVAGLLVIFICGVCFQGKFVGGFNWFILPEGLYSGNSMITFIIALVVPPAVTVGVSLYTPVPKENQYLMASTPVNNLA